MGETNKNNQALYKLHLALTDFSEAGTKNKIELLKQCAFVKLNNQKQVLQYHNNLLFLLSYAENENIQSLAQQEILRLTNTVKQNAILQSALIGSGIEGTIIQGAYSFTLIKWILKEFPGTISIHSFDETGVHPREILKHVIHEAEFELTSDENLKPLKWLEKACDTKDKGKILNWLINSLDNLKVEGLLKDQLFESMSLYTEIKPKDSSFSRSSGVVKISKRFFHTEGLIKKLNEPELIGKKLPQEKKLAKTEKEEIIQVSRIALCLLNRETDPITYCEELNVKYFELERGLSIALFSIDAKRRLPLESYIGFMMFKNGYPMSYGGAWLFRKRSLIGINIFEAFRGGESAIVFAQLLRCYKMAFGANYFEVEPYQFGKDNPEGIQSGAFWFYYRFGFKPCDKQLYELALAEHKKILETKGYRSPTDVLKQFTKSNLFVYFNNETKKPFNPSELSRFITFKINKDFNGDRQKALKTAVLSLKKEKIITTKTNSVGLEKSGLFIAFGLDLKKIPVQQKQLLQKIISAKGLSEFEYIQLLGRFLFEKYLSPEFKIFAIGKNNLKPL